MGPTPTLAIPATIPGWCSKVGAQWWFSNRQFNTWLHRQDRAERFAHARVQHSSSDYPNAEANGDYDPDSQSHVFNIHAVLTKVTDFGFFFTYTHVFNFISNFRCIIQFTGNWTIHDWRRTRIRPYPATAVNVLHISTGILLCVVVYLSSTTLCNAKHNTRLSGSLHRAVWTFVNIRSFA